MVVRHHASFERMEAIITIEIANNKVRALGCSLIHVPFLVPIRQLISMLSYKRHKR